MSQASSEPYDAVILAGGRARRMGGLDKPGLMVAGRPLIGWVAGAVAGAGRLVIVGPARPEIPRAIVVREDPPGGGPVPALRTGLAEVRADWVALFAADLPYLRAAHVDSLREHALGHDGAVFVDDTGRSQWLASVWRTESLRQSLTTYAGKSLHALLRPLAPAPVTTPPSEHPPWHDYDTLADADGPR